MRRRYLVNFTAFTDLSDVCTDRGRRTIKGSAEDLSVEENPSTADVVAAASLNLNLKP
jgi:hypothetical protein